MASGIERLAEGVNSRDSETFELGEELLAHQLNALQERRIGCRGPGRDRAIEIVQHLEQLDQNRALRTLAVARGVAAQPHADLLELLERASLVGGKGLYLRRLRDELLLEVFDIFGLSCRTIVAGGVRVSPRPPSPIDDADLRILFVFVGHHGILMSRIRSSPPDP